jgi:putative ABC transport system substrate-binding protein
MKRREFLALAGAAAAWPLTARGQQPAMPVIGFINSESAVEYAHLVAAFRQGLNEIGYAEGRNVAIEYRWAEGDYDRLPALAADLVRHRVAVIAALGPPAALVTKTATTMIPIAFLTGDDAVRGGLVASFNRPGGNITGVSLMNVDLTAKRVELLRELVPHSAVVAALVNPKNPSAEASRKEAQEAARTVGQRIQILNASTLDEIEHVFTTLAELQAGALLITTDALFIRQSNRLASLAAQHAIPAIGIVREFPAAGGLMSYGTSLADSWRQVGVYVGRILKGEKPADLPVLQPTKFQLVINLKTAKTLGITFPPSFHLRADEVIE